MTKLRHTVYHTLLSTIANNIKKKNVKTPSNTCLKDMKEVNRDTRYPMISDNCFETPIKNRTSIKSGSRLLNSLDLDPEP